MIFFPKHKSELDVVASKKERKVDNPFSLECDPPHSNYYPPILVQWREVNLPFP